MTPDESADAFQELYRAVYDRFHRRDAPGAYRVSAESLAVLRHLLRTGPLTVMEAARHLERSQSAMSEIVSRLERRGLLARMSDERDRRRTLVWLTDDGLVHVEKAGRVLSPKLLRHALDQLSGDARGRLLAGLEGLLKTDPHDPGVKDD